MSYLLRTCPACAAPLADDAPRCVRCRTKEAPESVPTTDILVRLSKINFNYAICLWKYHFYGYDSYRDDLRNSIEILEKYDTYPDGTRPAGVDEALIRIRNEQLDWCIHDLTPATFEAYRDS